MILNLIYIPKYRLVWVHYDPSNFSVLYWPGDIILNGFSSGA